MQRSKSKCDLSGRGAIEQVRNSWPGLPSLRKIIAKSLHVKYLIQCIILSTTQLGI